MAKLVEMRLFPDPTTLGILDIWTSGQVNLAEVIRWKKNYLDKGIPVRRQSTLAHTYGLAILGGVALRLLKPVFRAPYDYPLMMNAFLVHDHGEGELRNDHPATEKTDEHDLAEYMAFIARYQQLPGTVFAEFERAFLLQFAERNAPIFSKHAREVMSKLWRMNRSECLLFKAIEHWEYLLFGMEQYFQRGITENLWKMIYWSTSVFDSAEADIGGWNEYFWTPEVRAWCMEFKLKYYSLYAEEG